jgi:hypothetical protein
MNFVQAVQALSDAGVEFAIVDGWSAIMHGSADLTNDLDLCYSERFSPWTRIWVESIFWRKLPDWGLE